LAGRANFTPPLVTMTLVEPSAPVLVPVIWPTATPWASFTDEPVLKLATLAELGVAALSAVLAEGGVAGVAGLAELTPGFAGVAGLAGVAPGLVID
jgi:hypothetical protein